MGSKVTTIQNLNYITTCFIQDQKQLNLRITQIFGAFHCIAAQPVMLIIMAPMFTEFKEGAFQMFSTKVKILWSKWEPRGLVILSLTLQIVLVLFGNRRKFTSYWRQLLVWLAYLLADWVATISLSTLMRSQGEIRTAHVAFWAPFLLLHLGGSDTITAYSLEDNGLWIRHLLRLCVQLVVAFYVYWKFQTNNAITFLAIPIFVGGLIKYGERICALMYASSSSCKNSLFSVGERKPDVLIEMSNLERGEDLDCHLSRAGISPEAKYLHEGYLLFKFSRPFFLDLTLTLSRQLHDILSIKSNSGVRAFKLVEVELGFLYDAFYTKRILLRRPVGIILRSICFLSSCSTLVAFFLFIGFGEKTESEVDIGISYLLLVGAVALDIYSVITQGLSDWTMLIVTRHKSWLPSFVNRATASWLDSRNVREEIQSMAQYNLISFCLKSKTSKIATIERFLHIDLGKYWHTTLEYVNYDLKEMIYSHLLKRHQQYEMKNYERGFLNKLLAKRGNGVLEEKVDLKGFSWSINDKEFDHSLLLWHIATDICYHVDGNHYGTDFLGSYYKVSKSLSDYMFHLLVMHPSMIPEGVNEVRFRDTCKDVRRFLQYGKESDGTTAIMESLLDQPFPVRGKSTSVLFDGIYLANQLQLLVIEDRWDCEDKWEIISQVWVEMLTYAASSCGWKEHAQQLKRGRDLLTTVSLLMAHLGLSDKIHMVPMPDSGALDRSYRRDSWVWDSFYHLTPLSI